MKAGYENVDVILLGMVSANEILCSSSSKAVLSTFEAPGRVSAVTAIPQNLFKYNLGALETLL